MSTPHTILFHGNCIDGWFSAYFAYTSIGVLHPVQMYPIAPGQPNTWPREEAMAGTHILMLDVSVAQHYREAWLAKGALSVRCIDHHATSVEHWAMEPCPIHTETCAAMQTFRHFYPDSPIPYWLTVIDRVDRWDNVTYDDRCLREVMNIICHKPVEKKMEEAFALTNQFVADMQDVEKIKERMAQGKAILDKKDADLNQILTKGGIHTFTQEYVEGWKLPATWLDSQVYIIDNTNIVFDTTEAAHIVFEAHPTVTVFINYRKKEFYATGGNLGLNTDASTADASSSMAVDTPPKDSYQKKPYLGKKPYQAKPYLGKKPYQAKPYQGSTPKPKKTMYVYSARSRGVNLTDGTIFQGHPAAAGASIVQEEGVFMPFLLSLP